MSSFEEVERDRETRDGVTRLGPGDSPPEPLDPDYGEGDMATVGDDA